MENSRVGRGRQVVPPTGVEPATCRLGGGCSIRLSYEGGQTKEDILTSRDGQFPMRGETGTMPTLAPLAQSVEHLTFNQVVARSSRAGRTIKSTA